MHAKQLIIRQNRTIEDIGVCITHPYLRYRQYFAFCSEKQPKSTSSSSSCGSEVQSSPHCNGRSWLLLWKNTFAFLCGAGCALNCTHTLVRQCKSALVWLCSRVYSNVHWVEPALGSPSSIFTRQEWRITRACPTLVSPAAILPRH